MRSLPPVARLAFVLNAVFLLFASLLFASGAAHAAAGTLIGKTLTRVPGGNNFANRAVVQPDGKILIAGGARFGTMQYQITRYNTNGTIDTTFANGGTVLEPLGPGNGQAFAIALQADGKVVVAGDVTSDRNKFGIARFNTDGSLDLLFGGGGSAVAVGPAGDAGAHAMVIQPDGKIVLGGFSTGATGKKVFTLVRYTSVDTIDTTFGTNGFVIGAEGAVDEEIDSLGLQADGRIVAAGTSANGLRMQRYNADGTIDASWTHTLFPYINGGLDMVVQDADQKIAVVGNVPDGAVSDLGILRVSMVDGAADTTFGSGTCANGPCPGVTATIIGDSGGPTGLALQGTNYLVSGVSFPAFGTSSVVVFRFTSNGTLDTTFGTNGKASAKPTGNGDNGRGIALRANGGIVVAGLANGDHGDTDSLVTVFNPTGQLDNTFNGTGFSRLDVGSMTGEWRATALTGGKIVAAGFTVSETGVKGGVIGRYNADGTLDATFGTAGITTFPLVANAIAVQAVDGKLVVGGTALTGATPSMAFARFTANGALDTTFNGTGTLTIAPASADEEISSVAVQPDGKIVGAGFVTGTFLDSVFVRLTSAGVLDTTFNGSGKLVASSSTGADVVNALAIQADGKIVGGGWAEISGTQDSMTVTRVNQNGTLDTAFGTGGFGTATFTTFTSHGFALTIEPNGKIVIAGNIFNTGNSTDDFAIARFTTTGVLDTTFGTNGLMTNDFGNHNRIFALARLPSGKLLGAGETGGFFSLVQYLDTGALDTTFGTNGSSAAQINAGNDFANALTVGTDGTLFVSGNGSGLLALARFTSDIATTVADLAISQVASPSPAIAGQNVTFTITVSNAGPSAASSVTVTDTLPAGTTLVSASTGCTNASGTVTCNVGALANGATAPLTIVVHTTAAGSITNNASVSAAEADPSTVNNTSAATVTVNAAPPTAADVSITQAASATTVTAGDAVTFTLTVANAGPAAASAVTVTDTLPAGLTVTAMSPSCANGAGTLTCNVGTLAAGASTQLTVTLQTAAAGTLNNTATVSATQSDPNHANNTSSATVTVNPVPAGTVVNLSTRGQAGNGNNVLIAGFIIGGTAPKTVVVVAQGPSLVAGGVTNPLPNPALTLVRSSDQTVIGTNDDWGSAANAAQIQAAGFAPPDAKEAAIMMTLEPGAYTAIVSDLSGATGVGIVGVFAVDHPEVPLINISTRGQVFTGNDVMIAGFIIQGNAPRTVVIQGIGPALTAAGVPNALANPTLTLVRASDGAVIASNDDWQTASNAADIQAAGLAPSDPRESAIMMTLQPGAYTAILAGAGGGTGNGIVGVFTQ